MKSKFLKAAFAVVSACALMACCPEKDPSTGSGTLSTTKPTTETAQPASEKDMNKLTLTAEWDKVFPKSDKVEHSKVTFKNHFGIELAADMFVPKDTSLKVPRSLSRTILALNSPPTCSCPRTRASR